MKDREFLKKIRTLQESGKKISLTEFPITIEDTKKTNVLTLIKESSILREDDNIQTVDPEEQREEENKFKDIVSKLVKFEPIRVHSENVEWSGHLIREKIDWNFSLDDTVGCYIYTTELIQLRDEVLEVLKKLRGYYDVWADEWSNRLTGGTSETEEVVSTEEEFTTEVEGGEEAGFGGEEAGFGGEAEF